MGLAQISQTIGGTAALPYPPTRKAT